MSRLSVSLALFSLALAPALARADNIPYGNPGSIAPTSIIKAATTGDVMGYFFGANAAYTDTVRLVDETSGTTSPYFFNNQTESLGASANFGAVTAGDTLAFEVYDANLNQTFSSDPSLSGDGINHAYAAPYSGGVIVNGATIPAGTYIGMEDLNKAYSDFDYNDVTFVFDNISASSVPTPVTSTVPEPTSIALLGTGLLAAAGGLRKRLSRK